MELSGRDFGILGPSRLRLESASLSPDGQTLVTGSATGRTDFWMTATGEHITMKLDMGTPTGRTIVRNQPGGERVILGMETSGPFDDRRTPYKLNSIDVKSGSRCWSTDGHDARTEGVRCFTGWPFDRLRRERDRSLGFRHGGDRRLHRRFSVARHLHCLFTGRQEVRRLRTFG